MAAEGSLSRCPAGGFSEALGGGGERETESPSVKDEGKKSQGRDYCSRQGFFMGSGPSGPIWKDLASPLMA